MKKKAEEKKELIKKAEKLCIQSGIPVEPAAVESESPVEELRLADSIILQMGSATGAQEEMLLKKIENIISQDRDLRKKQDKPSEGFLPAGDLVSTTAALVNDIKSLVKDEERQTASDAHETAEAIAEHGVTVEGVTVMCGFLEQGGPDLMQNVINALERRNPEGVSVLAADKNGSSVIICSAGKEARNRGFHASAVLTKIGKQAGGGGGGSPSFARGGGGDPKKTREALEDLETILADIKT